MSEQYLSNASLSLSVCLSVCPALRAATVVGPRAVVAAVSDAVFFFTEDTPPRTADGTGRVPRRGAARRGGE